MFLQFLEEIWLLKDAMKKSPVEEIHMDGVNLTEKRVTLEDFISHELKRHEYKAFSDEELKSKPMSEIEYYYQFLTPGKSFSNLLQFFMYFYFFR